MDLVQVLQIAAMGGVGSILVWILIGPTVSGRGLQGFIKRAQKPGKAQELLFILFDVMLIWATTHKMKNGKKCKIREDTGEVDDKGNPIYEERIIDDEQTPIDMLISKMSKGVLAKMQSSEGGIKSQIMGALGAKRKSQSSFDFAVEQLMVRAGPLIDQKIQEKLKPPETY